MSGIKNFFDFTSSFIRPGSVNSTNRTEHASRTGSSAADFTPPGVKRESMPFFKFGRSYDPFKLADKFTQFGQLQHQAHDLLKQLTQEMDALIRNRAGSSAWHPGLAPRPQPHIRQSDLNAFYNDLIGIANQEFQACLSTLEAEFKASAQRAQRMSSKPHPMPQHHATQSKPQSHATPGANTTRPAQPNTTPAVKFNGAPISVTSSVANKGNLSNLKPIVEKLSKGGFSRERLLELKKDIQNLRGTGNTEQKIQDFKQKYQNALKFENDSDITGVGIAKMMTAISQFLKENP